MFSRPDRVVWVSFTAWHCRINPELMKCGNFTFFFFVFTWEDFIGIFLIINYQYHGEILSIFFIELKYSYLFLLASTENFLLLHFFGSIEKFSGRFYDQPNEWNLFGSTFSNLGKPFCMRLSSQTNTRAQYSQIRRETGNAPSHRGMHSRSFCGKQVWPQLLW